MLSSTDSRARNARRSPALALVVAVILLLSAAMLAAGCGSDASGSGPRTEEGFELDLVVTRPTSSSFECYSFHADGTVELRHAGSPDVTDVGSYSGDDTGGEISWDSGRYSSYASDGGAYSVDGAAGSAIESCLG